MLLSSAFTNVDISRMTGNQAEGAIAVDRADPSQVVAVSNIDVGDGLMVGRSSDGGHTWTSRIIANHSDELPPACCDPSLTFDSFGNLFLAYLNASDNAVIVLRSADQGASFSTMAEFPGNVDQPTIAAGPGSVWLTMDRGSGVAATGAAVTGLGAVGTFASIQQVPGSNGGSFGDIAVGPSGQVMVTYQKNSSARSAIDVNINPTGLGGSFSKPILVTTTNVGDFDFLPAQPSRGIDAEAGLAYDRSGGPFSGRVYMVYTDEVPAHSSNTDIFIRYSDDGGYIWSNPIRVNDDAGLNSQLLPRISLDNTSGQVAVSWYDARNDKGTGSPGDIDNIVNDDVEVYATVVMPQADGLIVAPNQQIAAAPSNAVDANNSIDLGDYAGLDAFQGSMHPLWFDNSNSTGDNPNGALKGLNAYTATVDESSFTFTNPVDLGGLNGGGGAVAALYFGSGANPGYIKHGRDYTITVAYTDPDGLTLASAANSSLQVTGPNAFSATAPLIHARMRRDGVVLATYRLAKPTGPFTPADAGVYTIALPPGQVLDGRSRPATAGILGTFDVATALPSRSHSGGTGQRDPDAGR